jgi:hypothetical protein
MESRSLNRPAYVIALLLGLVALEDAGNALITMQMPNLCQQFSIGSCGTNSGWIIDLGAAIVSAGLLALLLMRPHYNVLLATFGWAAVAFVANLAMRHSSSGPDAVATFRMTIYLLVAVIAAVLVIVEYMVRAEADRAAAPAPVNSPLPAPAPFIAPPGPHS